MTAIDLDEFLANVKRRSPGESEFHQAVTEFAESVVPVINSRPEYRDNAILERLVEPDRAAIFRVTWEDDSGQVHVNRGYRVQFNNTIGPYKGGLRFDPSVSLSVLKFLGFEQVFKNALTTLPLGGGKGGSDFNPKGRSDREVMRFCQAFMTQLFRHIGADVDVPAGDIGVGAREVGYLFGQYKRLTNKFTGTITGKGIPYGGSLIRTEATGYGTVYFAEEMLTQRGETIDGMTATVSGSGNVALHAAEKLIADGAKVLTLSDRSGFAHFAQGLQTDQLDTIKRGKLAGETLESLTVALGAEYNPNVRPWDVPSQLAFPCATQNELTTEDAKSLVVNGCTLVAEGANMPSTPEAVAVFAAAPNLAFGPGKAANAGGVAVSGLEMSQNASRLSWPSEKVDSQLKAIMESIHQQCVEYGSDTDTVDYVRGANVAGFTKIADAMLAQGIV